MIVIRLVKWLWGLADWTLLWILQFFPQSAAIQAVATTVYCGRPTIVLLLLRNVFHVRSISGHPIIEILLATVFIADQAMLVAIWTKRVPAVSKRRSKIIRTLAMSAFCFAPGWAYVHSSHVSGWAMLLVFSQIFLFLFIWMPFFADIWFVEP